MNEFGDSAVSFKFVESGEFTHHNAEHRRFVIVRLQIDTSVYLTGTAKAISVTSPDDPSVQSEEFLELANGCLCCSIKDVGIAAIEKLMQRRGAFDHIILETTGLADPGLSFLNGCHALGLDDYPRSDRVLVLAE